MLSGFQRAVGIASHLRGQWQHVLGILLALSVVALALNAALHFPIYPDEVSYKIFLERFIQNGWAKQSQTPYCAEGFLVRPFAPLWPAALLWTAIREFGQGSFSYRLLPLLCLGGSIGLLTANAWRKGERGVGPLLLLIAVGPVLYGLIILRPEILILAAGVALFFLLRPSEPQAVGLLIAKSSAALLVFDLAAYVHPKAMYLAPLVIVGLVLTGRLLARPAARVIYWGLTIIAVVSIVSSAVALHQAQSLSCHGVPAIEQFMSAQSLNPLDAVKNPSRFMEQVRAWWMMEHPRGEEIAHFGILDPLLYQTAYDVNYLPRPRSRSFGPPSLSVEEGAINKLILICVYGALAYLALSLWIAASVRPFRSIASELVLVATLAAGLLIPWILSISRGWYEISEFMGALAVVGCLLRPIVKGASEKQRLIEKYGFGLLGGVLMVTAAWSFKLNEKNFTAQFGAGYEGPGLSMKLDRALVARKAQVLLERYGVGQNEPLVIDDLSYEAVKNHPLLTPISVFWYVRAEPELIRKALRQDGLRYGLFQCSFGNETFSQMHWRLLGEIAIGTPYHDLWGEFAIGTRQYDLCLFDLAH